MRKTIETEIDGYEVHLELYEERGEPRSDCFVIKGQYSASLACLADTGELHSGNWDRVHEVHPQTITAIEKWAEENGY
jgi:hypothetical protein